MSRSPGGGCRRPSRLGDERGSATVLAAAMILVLGAVVTGGVLVGSAVVARHRAAAAADLAALSAAAHLAAGHDAACSAAQSVAASMTAVVSACEVDDLDVIVATEVDLGFGGGLAGPARAAARAGPVDTR